MYAFTVECELFCSLVGCPRSTRSRFSSWLEVEHGTPTSIIALIKHLAEGHWKPSPVVVLLFDHQLSSFINYMNYFFGSSFLLVWSLIFLSRILNSEWIIFGNYVRARGRNIGSTTDAYLVVRCWVIPISALKYLAHFQFRLKEICFKTVTWLHLLALETVTMW